MPRPSKQPRVTIKTEWLKGLPKEEAEKLKKLLLNSSVVVDKLREICYNSIRKIEKTVEADYDSPSWAYKQAHRNGKADAYRQIIELLSLTEDD